MVPIQNVMFILFTLPTRSTCHYSFSCPDFAWHWGMDGQSTLVRLCAAEGWHAPMPAIAVDQVGAVTKNQLFSTHTSSSSTGCLGYFQSTTSALSLVSLWPPPATTRWASQYEIRFRRYFLMRFNFNIGPSMAMDRRCTEHWVPLSGSRLGPWVFHN